MAHDGAAGERDSVRELDIDMARLEPAGRITEWQYALATLFGPLETEFSDESNLSGRLQSLRLGECTIVSIESNAHRVRRTPQLIRDDRRPAEIMLTYQQSGLSVIRQGGHTLLLRPGEFVVTRLDRAVEVIVNGHHERITATLPYAVLAPIVGDFDQLPASTIGTSEGPARILRSVLEGFSFNRALFGPFDRLSAGTFVRDLIAAVLREHARLPLRVEDRALTDVLAFVEHNLRDPDLTPAVVAASHFMSVRSLQLLFQSHNWTPSGWIRHRRMQHALHELSTAENSVTVSDIATHWGFADLAHFSRLFRQANGLSPREYRRAIRDGERIAQSERLTNTEDFFRGAARREP